MSEQDNIQTVQGLYAAFQRGDIQTILNSLAEDVEWVNAGSSEVAYAGQRHGREEVASFFKALGETLDIERFDIKEYVAQGDRVVVLGNWRARVKSNGRSFENDWAMAWKLRDGKVTSYCSYEDSVPAATAYRGS